MEDAKQGSVDPRFVRTRRRNRGFGAQLWEDEVVIVESSFFGDLGVAISG